MIVQCMCLNCYKMFVVNLEPGRYACCPNEECKDKDGRLGTNVVMISAGNGQGEK